MLYPNPSDDIPEMTYKVAQAAFPKSNIAMKIRDELGIIFTDKEFAEMYPAIGQPSTSPARLALVTIMQFLEDLSDREAADAVRGRIDWKYLLGLELDDAGFDYSVLSEFRQRLLAHSMEDQLLNKVLEQCRSANLLGGKSKQRSDSTIVLANIRTMNRVYLVSETMRRTLDDIAQVTPTWLKPLIQTEWGKRYGRALDNRRMQKSEYKREELTRKIGEDGYLLLQAIDEKQTPAVVKQLPSVATLRAVWVQQYYCCHEEIHWRSKKKYGLPPSQKMIASPDDHDARYSNKRGTDWIGYKVHFTETCTEGDPHLITHVMTTPATTADVSVTETIQKDLVAQQLAPETHLVDSGYTDADLLVSSRDKGIELLGPLRHDTSWQAQEAVGYDQSQFIIDWETHVAICPQGKTSNSGKNGRDRAGNDNVQFVFSQSACRSCAARESCTRAKNTGRYITVPPQETYEALKKARAYETTQTFEERYKRRAGIEGTISQAVNAYDVRHARYLGLGKTRLQHVATAAAINFQRVAQWLMGMRPETTRTSPFSTLVASFGMVHF